MTTEKRALFNETFAVQRAVLQAARKQCLEPLRHRDEICIDTFSHLEEQQNDRRYREIAVQRLDYTSRLLQNIDDALLRLGKDTYGMCERCRQVISTRRLEALPWARLCVTCQSVAEESGNAEPTDHSTDKP